jgi:hypothetical protein
MTLRLVGRHIVHTLVCAADFIASVFWLLSEFQ